MKKNKKSKLLDTRRKKEPSVGKVFLKSALLGPLYWSSKEYRDYGKTKKRRKG